MASLAPEGRASSQDVAAFSTDTRFHAAGGQAPASRVLLELAALSKSYGGANALDGASLSFREGEIHALLGENGAGKSTLIRLCTGIERPSGGQLRWKGEPVQLYGTRAAQSLGIRAVHQEAEFFPDLSLAENILHLTGAAPGHPLWLGWRQLSLSAQQDLAAFGLKLPVEVAATELSVAQRVLAEIAGCIAQRSSLLFLDEPTASLSATESEELFRHLLRLKNAGTAIVYVSHRLEEVLRIADQITILRDGRVAASGPRTSFDRSRLIREMVGRDIPAVSIFASGGAREEVFEARKLTDDQGRFQEISFKLKTGRITSLYGLVGAGRSELAQAIVGLRPSSGEMIMHGRRLPGGGPAQMLKAGVVLVPEDRRTQGVFPTHSCRENVSTPWLAQLGRWGFFSEKRERRDTNAIGCRLGARYRDIEQPISTLSGGNQQKLLLGRWLKSDPAMLIVDEPTRGVDIGAKAEIHREIREFAEMDRAVLVISSDLPEALSLGDNILVMRGGRLSGDFARADATETKLLQAALPDSTQSGPGLATGSRRLGILRRLGRELAVFAALGVLTLVLSLTCGREFASTANLFDILASASLVSIAAAGVAQVLIVGSIDISIGSMLGLVGALAGTAALSGVPPILAVALGIALGALLGACNATVAQRGRVHPIIVTLAGIYVFRGLMLRFTGGHEVSGFSPDFRAMTDGSIWGVPKIVCIAALVHGANMWFLERTLKGRQLYAVGSSEKAARLAGLRPERVRLLAFGVAGGLVGLCAVLWGAYYGKIQSNTGAGFELQAIAAAVIGGCAVTGGRGRAIGVVAGSILIAVVYNALVLLRIDSTWQGVFVGLLILLAPALDVWIRREAQRRSA